MRRAKHAPAASRARYSRFLSARLDRDFIIRVSLLLFALDAHFDPIRCRSGFGKSISAFAFRSDIRGDFGIYVFVLVLAWVHRVVFSYINRRRFDS